MRVSPKRGHYEDLVLLLKSITESINHPHAVRLYKTTDLTAAPYDQVVWEVEYESLAEYESVLHEWTTGPDAASFEEKYSQFTANGGTSEIWEVVTVG